MPKPMPPSPLPYGLAHSLVGTSRGRPEDDFYPTPPEATEALLRMEKFEGPIWEPACGNGAMSRILEQAGYEVRSSDLVDRGYGESGRDFLLDQHTRIANIVTNPPFSLADAFIRHALTRAEDKVAILGKLNLLEGQRRKPLFESTPLKTVYVFSRRLTLNRNGGPPPKMRGMIAFAWFVWQHGHEGPPTLAWL